MKSPPKRNFHSILLVPALLAMSCADSSLGALPPDAETISVGKGSVALWQRPGDQGTEHYYAISLDGTNYDTPKKTDYKIHLRYGSVSAERFANDAALSTDEQLYLVQFVTQPLEEYRRTLSRLGASIYQYMPQHAYIVKMDAATHASVTNLPFVRWVGAYKAEYRQQAEAFSMVEDGRTRLNIITPNDPSLNKETLVQKIHDIGGTVSAWSPKNILVDATIPSNKQHLVATWNEVIYAERWTAPENDMDIARQIGGAFELATVHGYDGTGVRAEVMDGNVMDSHSDFASRPLIMHGDRSGSAFHGTSTTGIVFGDGTGNSDATGMLPNAQGIFASYNSLSDRYQHTQELLQPEFEAVFQSNSWGGGRTTQYNAVSAEMDTILFDLDIPIFQSQSNAGNQQSRPQAWAKNIISVGGIKHQGTATLDDDRWGRGASIGPAEDGRIKPDLSHFYDSVISPSYDGQYTQFSGTSAATPIVAGHAGVFLQMWSEGLFGNSVSGQSVFADRPHMTTTKAFLINTAQSYSFSGLDHDLTRTHQGWGLPNVKRIYDVRDSVLVINETDLLTATETRTYEVEIEDGADELRATLVFADPAGNPAATQARVNDLSLRVISPSQEIYLGNVGLLEGNFSQAGGQVDHINSVENIFVPVPEPGIWRVEVTADEINQDGHIETPELDADFALVVTGGTAGEPPPPPPPGGNAVLFQVAYDTPGADSVEEFIQVHNPTDKDVDLTGWVLRDNVDEWTFPEGTTLAGQETLTVARDAAGFRAWQGVDPDIAGVSLALGNSGDHLTLVNAEGEAVDFVAWENAVPDWPLKANRNQLLERIDVTSESTPENWRVLPAGPQ